MAKGVQILTEEEEKAFIPNKRLQLTDKAEIKRQRKVIEEKDALITKFKKYDEERKIYCERLTNDYNMIKLRFAEFASAIDECEGIEDGTKEFYKNVIERMQKSNGKTVTHRDLTKIGSSYKKVQKLRDYTDDMECLITGIEKEKRDELLFVLNRMRHKCDTTLSLLGKLVTNMDIKI